MENIQNLTPDKISGFLQKRLRELTHTINGKLSQKSEIEEKFLAWNSLEYMNVYSTVI